ncbi:amidinotransferase [Mangrovactinospora gilvigrisea]|uniref:Amidinotransferase n=1 Tax=Mangrovactinospora gilvigrisea TaxID=1428644 RepID=A0A1J7BK88_9ACTN|nr:dimethylargininase [Mangrovactinospora gilvigrisea]OIV39095.1 amidinotransferase [Mangrovactinospora gilvigrisea]
MPEPRLRRYLLCPPEHFAVDHGHNPWMRPGDPVDVPRALEQWRALVDAYEAHGHRVDLITAQPGLPDMVFAANSACSHAGAVLGSRFHHEARRPESRQYELWFKAAGFDVLEPQAVCEGEGDLVPMAGPGLLLAGTGFRTAPEAHAEAAAHLGLEPLTLRLVDPRFYHLDTALFALDDANVAYCPEAFDAAGRAELAARFPDAVRATREDALAFGLNSVSDGRHVFIAPQAARLAAELAGRGYVPVPVDLDELHKAGGGIKCCTQEIRG